MFVLTTVFAQANDTDTSNVQKIIYENTTITITGPTKETEVTANSPKGAEATANPTKETEVTANSTINNTLDSNTS